MVFNCVVNEMDDHSRIFIVAVCCDDFICCQECIPYLVYELVICSSNNVHNVGANFEMRIHAIVDLLLVGKHSFILCLDEGFYSGISLKVGICEFQMLIFFFGWIYFLFFLTCPHKGRERGEGDLN